MQGPVVGVVVLHDLLGLVGDGGRDGTGVGGHIVLDLCLTLTVLAAAVRQLGLQSVGVLHVGHSVGVDGLLDAEIALHEGGVNAVKALKHRGVGVVEAVEQAGVHGVETVAQAVLKAIQLVHHALVVETTLDICLTGSTGAIAPAAKTTKAVAIAAKATPQRKEDDDDPPCAAAVAPTISVPVPCHSSDVSKTRNVHTSVKHIISSFGNISEWMFGYVHWAFFQAARILSKSPIHIKEICLTSFSVQRLWKNCIALA